MKPKQKKTFFKKCLAAETKHGEVVIVEHEGIRKPWLEWEYTGESRYEIVDTQKEAFDALVLLIHQGLWFKCDGHVFQVISYNEEKLAIANSDRWFTFRDFIRSVTLIDGSVLTCMVAERTGDSDESPNIPAPSETTDELATEPI